MSNEVKQIFEKTNALLSGHFLLTSGRHSNQYFQCAQVLQHPQYTSKICEVICDYFKGYEIDTVLSPAMGGIIVGQEVARQLGKRFIFTEREDGDMALRRGFNIEKGERVLVVEDVVTTGGSVFEVMDLVNENDGIVVGVGSLVDRSNGKVDFLVPQVSTMLMDVVSYKPEDCPLCKDGIELVKPGSRKVK